MDDFKHQPLEFPVAQIRLFRLTRSSLKASNELEGGLEIFGLDDDCPKYTALSYVWGSEDDCKAIWIDGRPLSIRRNLYDFLRSYSSSVNPAEKPSRTSSDGLNLTMHTYLWIDQLCIDQLDSIERGLQIQLMSRIYSQAAQTLVWLGAHDDQIADAMNSLRHGSNEQMQKDENNLADVLARNSYWTRLWVLQELHSLKILCSYAARHL